MTSPQRLHGGAVSDWRLGAEREESSLLRKLWWDLRPAELALPAAVALVAAVGVSLRGGAVGAAWGALEHGVAIFLALNFGYAVAIGTTPVKRYFHRHGDIRGGDLATLLVDAVFQIVLFDAVFGGTPVLGLRWGYSVVLASHVVVAVLGVVFAPLYLRRALAHAFALGGIALALYVLPSVPAMEWFPFVVLYKYVTSHAPREEPYR